MEIRTHFHSFNLVPCCVAFRGQISTHFGSEKCSRLLRMSQIEWWPLTVLIISTNKWLFVLHLSCFFLSSALLLFWRKTDATIENFPTSSGNETTFRTVDVLLTLVEKIINKFHHSKCSSLAETKNYREIADNT